MSKNRIVLYGIGKGCEYVRNKINTNTEIVGFSDSYSSLNYYLGSPFIKVEDLNNTIFDYVVVTIIDKEKAASVGEMLAKEYGISREKIILYFWCCNHEKYVSKLSKLKSSSTIDYLILGNSHAECGLMECVFPGECINLAVSSQDIYYNSLVAKEFFGYDIKTIIFDLYDYSYLNIDTSRGKFCIDYFCGGGIQEAHNWSKRDSIDERLLNESMIDIRNKTIMRKLFIFDDCVNTLKLDERWHEFAGDFFPINVLLYGSKSIYQDTIAENKRIMENFLNECVNRNIKVVFTLLPRYVMMEKLTGEYYSNWKDSFLNYVENLCKKFGSFFLNYKERIEISGNRHFYFDADHLNTAGAYAMTSIVVHDIESM